MLLEANLTESHKTSVRDEETKFFDEIKEKQIRNDKEPTSQFYGITFKIDLNNNLNTNEIKSLQVSGNLTYPTIADSNYQNSFDGDFFKFSNATIKAGDLNIQGGVKLYLFYSLDIIAFGLIPNYISDYSIDIIYSCIESANNNLNQIITDFVGQLNYFSTSNSFTFTPFNKLITIDDDFVKKRIINGQSRILASVGFLTAAVPNSIKQHMRQCSLYPQLQNEIIYAGLTK
jgi:hypothetical protein